MYDYGNLTTAARTYNYSYANLGNNSYLGRFILNRLASATVTDGSGTTTLVTNTYDGGGSVANEGTPTMCAGIPWNDTVRGNLVSPVGEHPVPARLAGNAA